MSDGLFFSLILGFFFIVWLAGGGPHRPISFAGPFITPITTVGDVQSAYGPNLSGKISAGGVTVGTNVPSNVGSDDIPNTSPYAGRISLAHFVSGIGDPNPAHEYLTLTSLPSATGSIDITGWKLVSVKTGVGVSLPQGATMLTLGPVQISPIQLQPGGTVTITSGYSPVNVSYEQSVCTSYLPNASNYQLCFSRHAGEPGYLTGNWQVFLNQNHTLWQKSDTIELVDENGRVVDSFAY